MRPRLPTARPPFEEKHNPGQSEVYGFLGHSGAGKTTTLRVVAHQVLETQAAGSW